MAGMDAPAIARTARLLADDTRAAMCLALLDGRAWTAGELARHTGVAASTATEHLHRLIDGGLLTQERQGRHRYVRLAGPDVAELVESLSAHAGPPEPVRSLRAARVSAVMAAGRTCYDHLAGRLGVAITDAMTDQRLIDQRNGFRLTVDGVTWFEARLGQDLRGIRTARPVARSCVDWTERRAHLAGLAGARLCAVALERVWVKRVSGTRAVRLTPTGESALRDLFGDGICHTVAGARSD
jgi:DNA-binding transcriptional ArsR family regulator